MLKNVLQICFVCVLNGILSNGKDIQSIPATWTTNVLQDHVQVSALKTIEPGFDLDQEEITKFKLWPRGIISYYIDDFSFDKVLRDRIRSFLDASGSVTGLHFLELPNPPQDQRTRWIFFVNRRGVLGCTDHSIKNFTNEGIQKVVLGYDCICNGGELAEVVLAIAGVPPQHNAPDRDNYVSVQMDKIIPGKKYLFEKLSDREWLFHDLEYDFTSASHFNFHKYSTDGSATIEPKKPVDELVGEGSGLSYTDVLKVRMLYNYISRKKLRSGNGSECKKLFKPGSNLHQHRLSSEDDVKPRRKPNKYLGLPDDEPNEGNTNDKVDSKREAEDNIENKNSGQSDIAIEKEDINIDNKHEEKHNVLKGKVITPLKLKDDPFTILSDYETDDNKFSKKDIRNRNLRRNKINSSQKNNGK